MKTITLKINILLLISSALFACNHSDDNSDLEKFIREDDSLTKLCESITLKTDSLYSAIEMARINNPERGKTGYDKAMMVKQTSHGFSDFIRNMKKELILHIEQSDIGDSTPSLTYLKHPESTQVPSWYFFGKSDGIGMAWELKEKINIVRNIFSGQISMNEWSRIKMLLNPVDQKNQEGNVVLWEIITFKNKSVAVDFAILSRLEIEMKQMEEMILAHLANQTD